MPGVFRSLLVFAFWIWGVAGFMFAGFEFWRIAQIENGVGIGTSGFFMAETLLWIGGMLFLGMAALLIPVRSEVLREIEEIEEAR